MFLDSARNSSVPLLIRFQIRKYHFPLPFQSKRQLFTGQEFALAMGLYSKCLVPYNRGALIEFEDFDF